jgi:glutaredoxin
MNVVIYSKPNCVWCDRAKTLLQQNGLSYSERDVTNPTFKMELLNIIKDVRTVPQIFINDNHIGGFKELNAYLT